MVRRGIWLILAKYLIPRYKAKSHPYNKMASSKTICPNSAQKFRFVRVCADVAT